MTDVLRCKEQIENLYTADTTLLANFSTMTKRAWGDKKAECMQQFNNDATKVRDFLTGKKTLVNT
jgi:hypothetical protein